jgi:hypothetical protein
VAQYHFDGSYADASGFGNDLIAQNPQGFVAGARGLAAAFPAGNHSYLVTAGAPQRLPLGNSPHTVSAWVSVPASGGGPVLSWGYPRQAERNSYMLQAYPGYTITDYAWTAFRSSSAVSGEAW